MIHVLSFSTNKEILAVMDRLVNQHSDDWTGHRAGDMMAAVDKLVEFPIDVILLGAGTDVEDRESLQQIIDDDGLKARIVVHYGGGSGLLYAEVEQALVG